MKTKLTQWGWYAAIGAAVLLALAGGVLLAVL